MIEVICKLGPESRIYDSTQGWRGGGRLREEKILKRMP